MLILKPFFIRNIQLDFQRKWENRVLTIQNKRLCKMAYFLIFFKTLYVYLFNQWICKFPKRKEHSTKRSVWMSVSIRFHDFPGGTDLAAGFPSFHTFLFCTADAAAPCSWASSRTNFLNKSFLLSLSHTSAPLSSHPLILSALLSSSHQKQLVSP